VIFFFFFIFFFSPIHPAQLKSTTST